MTTDDKLGLKTSIALIVVLDVFVIAMCAMFVVIGPLAVKVIMLALTGAMIWLTVLLAKRRLFIDAHGLHAKTAFGTREIAWDEVDHYTYWSQGQQAVYVGGAGLAGAIIVGVALLIARALRKTPSNRQFTMGQLVIVGKDGRRIVIDRRYKQITDALDRCFAELHSRMRVRPRDYAPYTVSDTELVHPKKGAIGLADIEKVDCAQARLAIRKRGKRLAWSATPMRRVKNVMLLVEDLAERGLVVNAQSEVFVPPPVLTKLLEAASRQAALPRAEIRRR